MANRRKKKKNRWMAALRDVLLALLLIGVVVSVIALIYGKLFGWNETKIAPNRYRTEAFYREDGFLRYQDAPYMIGIDVSAHQGQIDWERVRDAGVEFAILRAGFRGYAEGTLSEDDYFRENYEGARRAGLKIGVYFFSQARSEAEAMEEAQFVCSLLAGCTLDLPVYFDWETVDKSDRITGVEDIPITQCAVAFCEEIERSGFDAGVYFNQTYGYMHLELEKLQDYALWLAEYNDTPGFAYHFHCLQYSDSGSVDGIKGKVDLDLLMLED